jgi:hypothetical protein
MRRKGSYVAGWPTMSAGDAIARTRQDLAHARIGLAGRTGDGVAVFDLDAKDGVVPSEMLPVLRRLVGPAVIAIVRTSRGFHMWLRVAESVGNGFCSFIGGEIFSDPHLAMLPPSLHPSGHQYTWEVEPREPETAVNLRALGLVPDKPKASLDGRTSTLAPAPPEIQQEFARLMAGAGVQRVGDWAQTLTLCPWHGDRSPSLSINWDGAVFYCFSEQCGARGGIGALRRRVGANTPSYRQWPEGGDPSPDHGQEDHLSGDNLGCLDVDAATERLAAGLRELDFSERAHAVSDCRTVFRVGICTSCARTPAFPISCGHPLCLRCMPGRLAADWTRHRPSLPAMVNIVLLRPLSIAGASAGVLKSVRSRFSEWRKRAGIEAGIYGSRLDRVSGATIMLAIPSDVPIPTSSRAFNVETIATDRTPAEFLRWLQSQYVDEAQGWETVDELRFLLAETKGRRRYQGFGGIYGEAAQDESKEEVQVANSGETKPDKPRALGRISGGSFKGKREKGGPTCGSCGGVVELYPFTVPAAEVTRAGNHWLWNGPSAGPPAGRRPAR